MRAIPTPSLRFLPRGPLDLVRQFAIVLAVYEGYRLTRGSIDDPLAPSTAFANANWIIDLERALHLDVEGGVQRFSESVWGLPEVSSFLYINVQVTVTFVVMAYLYLRHTPSFGYVRNVFLLTWAIALVGFVLLPTAPPRLIPGLGINDSVAAFTGLDPSTGTARRFYNPYAAMPSLHVGIATVVGLSLARLSTHRLVRIAWALYPMMVVFVVMATGNHYFLDAVAGVLVAALAAVGAHWLGQLRPHDWALPALPA